MIPNWFTAFFLNELSLCPNIGSYCVVSPPRRAETEGQEDQVRPGEGEEREEDCSACGGDSPP